MMLLQVPKSNLWQKIIRGRPVLRWRTTTSCTHSFWLKNWKTPPGFQQISWLARGHKMIPWGAARFLTRRWLSLLIIQARRNKKWSESNCLQKISRLKSGLTPGLIAKTSTFLNKLISKTSSGTPIRPLSILKCFCLTTFQQEVLDMSSCSNRQMEQQVPHRNNQLSLRS